MSRSGRALLRSLAIGSLVAGAGCAPADTSHLSPARDSALTAEGIRFRGTNLTFRFTDDAGWENRVASIVVTPRTVLIYKNEKVGIEITPTSRRAYEVHREGDRVRINAGSGQSKEVWSFVPPDSAPAWTEAIRGVIKGGRPEADRP